MNYDSGCLQKHAFTLDGVTFMGLDDLVKLKRSAWAAKKDKADITLIETYRKSSCSILIVMLTFYQAATGCTEANSAAGHGQVYAHLRRASAKGS